MEQLLPAEPEPIELSRPARPRSIERLFYNVRNFFGWTSTAEEVATALREAASSRST